MIISPERLDPFADGKTCYYFCLHHNFPIFLHPFMVHCKPLVGCSTLRPQYNALLPILDWFPVVNTVWFQTCLFAKFLAKIVFVSSFDTHDSVGSLYLQNFWVYVHRVSCADNSPLQHDHAFYGKGSFQFWTGNLPNLHGLQLDCVKVEGWTISCEHSLAYDGES